MAYLDPVRCIYQIMFICPDNLAGTQNKRISGMAYLSDYGGIFGN